MSSTASTPADNANTLHREMREYLDKYPFPDLSGGNPNALKDGTLRANRAAHLAVLRPYAHFPWAIPDLVAEFEHTVELEGVRVPVKIYVPVTKPASGRPVIVMLHEGGWCMGDLSDEEQNCRLFSLHCGAVCVNVDYNLAPEYQFPSGLVSVEHVVEWCRLTANPASPILPGDLRQGFIIGGSSAGGNLAAAVCQRARDRGMSPPLTGQFLRVPALLWPTAVPQKWKSDYRSRFESKSNPVFRLDPKADQDLLEILKPDISSPLFSPLLHPNLRDLPPAYFQIAGLDPLKDEGLIYERVLREENGVLTRLDIYEGFGHMFWTNWPTMQRSREFVQESLNGMRWLLEVGKPRAV